MAEALPYTHLKHTIDVNDLPFDTTAELEPNQKMIGQARAEKALKFGLEIETKGYNIFVCGIPGTGRTTFSKIFAREKALGQPTPPDLCYVYNFHDEKMPKLLKLPAGMGTLLKADMEELAERLQDELPRVFEGKDFEKRKTEIVKTYQNKRDGIIKTMTEAARAQNFDVKTTNSGIYFMPIVNGAVISEEEYDALQQEQKDSISQHSDVIQSQAQQVMREIKSYEKETREAVEKLEYSAALFTVGRLMSGIFDRYADQPDVVAFLQDVKEDVLENMAAFVEEDNEEEAIQSLMPWMSRKNNDEVFIKYHVNLLTDNSRQKGAPVIVEFNPTYANLIGEIEYDNEYGNLTTDFMKIKPGILHKANGGYLILQARDVFAHAHSWETLRRVLLTNEIVIEPLREYTTGYAVSGIKPEPAPVDVKIILVGDGLLYDILSTYDDAFLKLFKICADFDYEMHVNDENCLETIRFIKRCVEKEKLPELDRAAVARVLEYASRLAESQRKMTVRFSRIRDILVESAAWAKLQTAEVITKSHVHTAIDEREARYKLYEEKLTEMYNDSFIMIDTTGEKIGQINGLAVIDMGEYAFAKPSRITATTYVGKAGVINIEQEADMSGRIHDKGVQVLSGYLGQIYAQDFPLSLSARVCFEQSYSGIDGDSASSAELYAILSSLADLSVSQAMAVTGSINQRGEIQPIGGVTLKVEGFFDLCVKRGLTGRQGVIIPAQNARDLMLRDDVVDAVRDGLFHIYPIRHIDEGIALLTGIAAGVKDVNGQYAADSVHGKVQRKLEQFFKKSQVE